MASPTITTPTPTAPATHAAVPAAAQREIDRRSARRLAPRVDIYETDQAFVLLADMPGVRADGLEVVCERESLVIRGRVERSADADYAEFERGDYYRTFMLTEDLDADRASASLHDGVVRVEIPKSPRTQPKKIPVRTE
jgi:HSP20 family molecular chaperone IbpA